MHTRCPLIHHLALALWAGFVSIVCGKEILTYTESQGGKIVMTCPFDETPAWGFLPLGIQVENPGGRAADWRIAVSSMNYSGGSTIRGGFDFRARAGDVTRGAALIPIGNIGGVGSYGSSGNYINFEAVLTGGGSGRGNFNTRSSSQSTREKTTLITQGSAKLPGHVAGTRFYPDEAPADWRAYCGFHSLYLTAAEWEAMTPAARTAIHCWIRLDGHLHLIDLAPGKSLTDMGLPEPEAGRVSGAVSHGSVDEIKTGETQENQLKKAGKSAETAWAVRATSGAAVKDWAQRDESSFAMPSAKVAAGFMLVVVVVFAVLVGPVNVFVLAPARRRHRLFLTTPLISLAAGGLLVVSVILSDGIGGKGVRYVWMESGPGGENTHYLVQHQHSRCGAMFTTGFEIPEDAYFTPMVLENAGFTGNLSVELTPGKVRADGPWFSSRRSQNFYLAAARPARGRIEKSGTDERPVLTSAFDFPIERIFWLAADGRTWWQAAALPQGTATALQPCTVAEVRKTLADATAHAPPEYGQDLTSCSGRPGYFLAMASHISAIETHKSIRWQTHGFVTGPVVSP